MNGVSFVASNKAIDQEHITPIKRANFNYVTLMPFGMIKTLKSPKIAFNSNRQWFGETINGIKQNTQVLHRNHFKIMLKPQIWVRHGAYTGFIEMESEENWKLLEASYTDFILLYAKLAQEIDIEALCIGTELEKFVKNRPEFWVKLIQKIKKIYSGKLTYAANWDEYKRVTFWNQLDYIGVDAYFPLSDAKTPSVKELEKGWQPHKKEIKRIQQQFQKQILFTEFGYRSTDYNAKEPWLSDYKEKTVNLEAQKNATQAIFKQFWSEDWFAGGFIWKWFQEHQKVGGKNNNLFTPQNKPTEKLIQQFFAK